MHLQCLGTPVSRYLTSDVIDPIRQVRKDPWGSARQLANAGNIRNMMEGMYLSVREDPASSQGGGELFRFGSLVQSFSLSWLARVG
jgi:hypothetical protein